MPRYLVPKIAFRPALMRPAVSRARLPWSTLHEQLATVPVGGRVVGEFGIGDGEWLAGQAAADPDGLFIGVEVIPHYFAKCARRMAEAGLTNVFLAMGDARLTAAPGCIPPGSLSQATWLFPDPWVKRRQRRRRMLATANAPFVARLIQPGGLLRLRTDVPDYVTDAEANFVPLGFTVIERSTSADTAVAITRWERKQLGEGLASHELRMRKVAAMPDPGDDLPIDPRGIGEHGAKALQTGGFEPVGARS